MILKVTGSLLLIEAAFMLIPGITSLCYGEDDIWPFFLCVAFTAFCGTAMRCIRPRFTQMGRREGFLLTSSVWIWFSLFGMLDEYEDNPERYMKRTFRVHSEALQHLAAVFPPGSTTSLP